MKKSTNLAALCGEVGRLSLSVIRKINIFEYWIKILNQNNSSLFKQIYLMLREDVENHSNYNGKKWASQIKDMLQQQGIGYVWEQQFDIEIPF